jgi:hypothetical protein
MVWKHRQLKSVWQADLWKFSEIENAEFSEFGSTGSVPAIKLQLKSGMIQRASGDRRIRHVEASF